MGAVRNISVHPGRNLRCSRQGRGSRLGGPGPGGLPVIRTSRQGRHDGVRGALAGKVNQTGDRRKAMLQDLHDSRRPGKSPRRRARRRDRYAKATAIMVALRTEHLTQRQLIAAAYSPTVRALAAMITTSNEQITALELTFRTSAR